MSSIVQSAETIQESIGAHYTLKLIQKENKNSVSKIFCADSQQIVIKALLPASGLSLQKVGVLRNRDNLML
ncbi:hypothetical protein CJP72_08920 [Citrobacter sp. NCU1]|nr:hypothetical protein [Citrobacter sp. NCU1]